jgi:hypothetical protein
LKTPIKEVCKENFTIKSSTRSRLTAVFSGSAGELFLGTQGDPWDTQACLLPGIGASVALLLLSRAYATALLRLPFPV